MTDSLDQAALDAQEANLQAHAPELAMLSAEATRQMAEVGARIDSAASRATILISSAAVASGIQATASASVFQILALVFSFATALLAIPVILFHKGQKKGKYQGNEVSINDLQDNLLSWSPRRLEWDLINSKRAITMHDRDALDRRARYLRAGFVSLAVAIVFTALQLTGWLSLAMPMHPHH